MKINKKKLIVLIIIIVVIIGFCVFLFTRKNNNTENVNTTNNTQNEEEYQAMQNNLNIESQNISEQELEEINTLKNEIGSEANPNMYEVAEEYDGRKTLEIRPSIQFQTALAGAIKNGMPTEQDVSKLSETFPYNTGIYIAESSREKFINLLNNLQISNFIVKDDGYLAKKDDSNTQNETAQKIESLINGEKLYVISMTGTCYMRDDITGEITEYPFEKMDPTQILEPFISDNSVLLAINSNQDNKISAEEIIQTIFQY